MSSNEMKEIKAITLQILKNQTLIIAHLVNQAQQQNKPPLKMEPRELSIGCKRKAPTAVEQPKQRRARVSTTVSSNKFCSVCQIVVSGDPVGHIWEHILKKTMKEKGAVAYSFVCDVKGCLFRTNKLEAAGGHASKHPEVERNKVMLDNRENTEPLFLATLAQCYEGMSDSEKDTVFCKCYD